VTTRPLGSVLALSDFTGASFDAEGIRVLKEAAAFDKPFVKKSAFVGTENFLHHYPALFLACKGTADSLLAAIFLSHDWRSLIRPSLSHLTTASSSFASSRHPLFSSVDKA
jgi:hypothetical protein